jgi:hypothetical protein
MGSIDDAVDPVRLLERDALSELPTAGPATTSPSARFGH